jgi:hypothetical protein
MELNMKFTIEQIAICPKNPVKAKKLLSEIGAVDWVEDHVVATGSVFGIVGTNEADLSFNYDIFSGKEFEVLDYTEGNNWMDTEKRGRNSVSHLGMHCTNAELCLWKTFFEERDIGIAQEVFTDSHTNAAIAGKRSYHYVIFDTKDILGVDLKFIVRIDNDNI